MDQGKQALQALTSNIAGIRNSTAITICTGVLARAPSPMAGSGSPGLPDLKDVTDCLFGWEGDQITSERCALYIYIIYDILVCVYATYLLM